MAYRSTEAVSGRLKGGSLARPLAGEEGAGPRSDESREPGPSEGGIPDTRILGIWRRKGGLLMLLDAVIISSAFMLAYALRFEWPVLAMRDVPVPDILPYLHGALLLTLFWVFLIWRDKGYASGFMAMETLMHKMRTVLVSGLYAIGLLMVISFLIRPALLSRQVFLMTWVLALWTMYLSRLLFRAIDQDLADQGMVAHRLLMVGLNQQVAEFAALLSSRPTLCNIVGFAALKEDGDVPDRFEGFPVLGRLESIREIHRQSPFDKLVLCNAMENQGWYFINVLNFCESENIPLYTLPNRFQIAVDQREVGSITGIPMILLRDAAVRPCFAVLKRLLDLFCAALVLILGLPFWLVIAAAIKCHDGGPVLFFQVRAGLHGHPFRMIKFRSMVTGADDRLTELVDLDTLAEPVFKIKNDPRVTPLGRFLRRTGLDEIPQMINVLKGEMSLVGPRPEEMVVVEHYTPWQRRRLKAVPGITGYQQIHNRGEPDLEKRIAYDLIYVKHQNLLLDLYILFKTVKVVLFGRGVTH